MFFASDLTHPQKDFTRSHLQLLELLAKYVVKFPYPTMVEIPFKHSHSRFCLVIWITIKI